MPSPVLDESFFLTIAPFTLPPQSVSALIDDRSIWVDIKKEWCAAFPKLISILYLSYSFNIVEHHHIAEFPRHYLP